MNELENNAEATEVQPGAESAARAGQHCGPAAAHALILSAVLS